jgi:hypothetical protein
MLFSSKGIFKISTEERTSVNRWAHNQENGRRRDACDGSGKRREGRR